MSILSLLASMILVGIVYGLSFLPSASLARPDDEVGLGTIEKVTSKDDCNTGEKAAA